MVHRVRAWVGLFFFFFQAEDGIRDLTVTGVQTCALPISKLKSTYVDALPKLIHPETGRLHTSFSQTGTATGRLSSSDPNLHNIPIRSELGREIRAAFVAGKGKLLLSARSEEHTSELQSQSNL